MRKLFILSILIILMFSSSASAAPCAGGIEITKDVNEPFGFCWDPNPVEDAVKHYVIYRDGLIYKPGGTPAMILSTDCAADRCDSPDYTEAIPGDYVFVVVAVDDFDYVSEDSDIVTLHVVNQPPSRPGGCSIR